ncbi:MAG: hypothetical protein HQK86_14875 [Nitrospinae bacterium]|nr:hypothetical protein [Nitrospinota bacterium]
MQMPALSLLSLSGVFFTPDSNANALISKDGGGVKNTPPSAKLHGFVKLSLASEPKKLYNRKDAVWRR